MRESDILHEQGDYWVCRSKSRKQFEVYKAGITHSVRVAVIGYPGEEGLKRCKAEIERRIAKDNAA